MKLRDLLLLAALLLIISRLFAGSTTEGIRLINVHDIVKFDNNSPLLTFYDESSAVTRFSEVKVAEQIASLENIAEGDRIILNLFDDVVYSAITDFINVNNNGTRTLRARTEEYELGYLVISTTGQRSLASISIPEKNEYYVIISEASTLSHFLLDIDPEKQKVIEDTPAVIPPSLTEHDVREEDRIREEIESIRPDDPAVIDVMVVYTPSALNWANSSGGGINNVIANAITTGQLAHDNSESLMTINLVHSAEVNYSESGSASADLRRITASSTFNPWGDSWNGYDIPGYMDEVHIWRDGYGADLVALLASVNDVGGVAWLLNNINGLPNYGFSLTRVQSAANNSYTFIHELGHNMGLHHHAAQNTQPGPTNWVNWYQNGWSAGWRWTGTNSLRYCSVMTYTSGSYFDDGLTHSRVPYFSSPLIIHQDVPTGDPVLGDNSRTLREIRHVMAAYRPTADLTPFSGTYTIKQDGTGDYGNFTAAIQDITIRGVVGAVIFDVHPGVYTEQLSITGIPGVSSQNTVTFRGISDDRQEVVLSYTPVEEDSKHLIRLENTSHLRFDNLRLEVTENSDFGWTFHIMNNTQDIEITNCYISTISTSNSLNYNGITVSGSPTSVYTGATDVHDLLIENNIITGGYSNIFLRGLSENYNIDNIQIHDNVLIDGHFFGIVAYHASNPTVKGNDIEIRSTGVQTPNSYGICLFYAYGSSELAYNKISHAGLHGIYLNYANAVVSDPSLIYNNMIGGGFRNTQNTASGIYLANSSNLGIYYNSINMDGLEGKGINALNSVSQLSVQNNSFAYSGSGDGYAAYYHSTATLSAHDHNNYFSSDSDNFVYYGTDVSDLYELQALNIPQGNDQNSRTGDPVYQDETDLYAYSSQLFAGGMVIGGIEDDIDGNLRDTESPCIGANEYTTYIVDLEPPVVTAEITGNNIVLSWLPVENAHSYRIYASSDVSPADWGEPVTVVSGTEYSEPLLERRFFRVTASYDIIP